MSWIRNISSLAAVVLSVAAVAAMASEPAGKAYDPSPGTEAKVRSADAGLRGVVSTAPTGAYREGAGATKRVDPSGSSVVTSSTGDARRFDPADGSAPKERAARGTSTLTSDGGATRAFDPSADGAPKASRAYDPNPNTGTVTKE
jgi:hypothetical protein